MKNRFLLAMSMAITGLVFSASAVSQANEGQGQAIVTVVPKHKGEAAPNVNQQDIQSVKVNGKSVQVTSFRSLAGTQNKVELVILIDDAARSSFGRQIEDVQNFVRSLPPNVSATLGYMENGRAALAGPFTTDRQQTLRGLHLPIGTPGVDASPYFCLSDLAKSWPSQDRSSRREVVMITDGIDYYYHHYDPDDPYVQAAITDSIRAGLVVYSIYWENTGRIDRTIWGNNSGQNWLTQVDEATGGSNFWQGFGNPVTFQPYFDELTRRLNNQYELSFNSQLKGKPDIATFRLKLAAPGSDVESPQQVFVVPAGNAQK